MKDIKNTISENLITLRKSHNLTQNELAIKLNYSDNMVSRWERGEIIPSVETLQKISEFYDVPLTSLFNENATIEDEVNINIQNLKKFFIVLLMVATLWVVLASAFFITLTVYQKNIWQIFILGVPLTSAIMLLFNGTWNKYVYRFVVLSVFIWSSLAFLYLQFLKYNIFYIFLIGIPAEFALVIWAFINPKNKK